MYACFRFVSISCFISCIPCLLLYKCVHDNKIELSAIIYEPNRVYDTVRATDTTGVEILQVRGAKQCIFRISQICPERGS